MTAAPFEPTLLSPPLSGSCHGLHSMPDPPRAPKRTSRRVNELLLDNLELLAAPLSDQFPSLGETSDVTAAKPFVLRPQLSSSALPRSQLAFQDALQRMRKRPAPGPIIIANPKVRRAPILPTTTTSSVDKKKAHVPGSPATPGIKEHEMERTPIRGPPQRSNSGLARCA